MKEFSSEKILKIQRMMEELSESQRERRKNMPERRDSRRCETCLYVVHEPGDRSAGIWEAWFCTAWSQMGTHPAPCITGRPDVGCFWIEDPQCPDGMLCASYEPDPILVKRWDREEDFMMQLWEDKMMEDAKNAVRYEE